VSKHTLAHCKVIRASSEARETEQEKGESSERDKLEIMAATRNFFLPAIMVFLVLSAVAVGAARPLAGEELSGEATAGESIVRFLRQIYRQRLNGPGHSCETWNPNGGC
uniref:Uncharacterized protein n=3 Tax=Setaria TaxID=4554 RepID=K3Z0R0_SETIT